MIFDDFLAGTSLFVDANPLVYYFASDPLLGATCARRHHGVPMSFSGFHLDHAFGLDASMATRP